MATITYKTKETIEEAWYKLTKKRWIPYPLRAAKVSVDFRFFGFWWKPSFTHKKDFSETAKSNGETIWWARWAFFQISYSRWV
tara:strand:- start:164 stop:412 length:249 start_codon:yes stop_codon:yes gene_type:complete